MSDDMQSISIWAPTDHADELDEMAERWDRHVEGKTVKRSVPGRAALAMGIAMLEMMEHRLGTRRVATMGEKELAGAARQGAVEYLNDSDAE